MLSCVHAFSRDYDFSEPYFPQTNETVLVRVDSTFQPDPPEGWFGLGNALFQPPILALNLFQTAPWFHISTDPNTTALGIQDLGTREKPQALANPLSLSTTTQNTSSLEGAFGTLIVDIVESAINQTDWSGILADFDTFVFANISVNATEFYAFLNNSINFSELGVDDLFEIGLNLTLLQPVPWFEKSSASSEHDLDDQVSQDITNTLSQLSLINVSSGVNLTYNNASFRTYPAVAASIQVVTNMPWGNLRFSRAQNGSYAYLIQAGTNERLSNVGSYPPEGLRKMAFQIMFARALCRTLFVSTHLVKESGSNVTITPTYRVMPRYFNLKLAIPVGLFAVIDLYPFAISFFIPLFVYTLTTEKESRIFIMMKVFYKVP